MKLWRVFIKTSREQFRSYWDLILSISLAPLFLVMYWVFLGSGSAIPLEIIVINQDSIENTGPNGGVELTRRLTDLQHSDGTPVFKVQEMSDLNLAEKRIAERRVLAAVVIPPEFSRDLQRVRISGGTLTESASALVIGDQGHPYYAVAAVFLFSEIENYVLEAGGQSPPFVPREEFVGDGTPRRDFDNYVPGLLIAAVTLVIFSVSLAVAREIENGTLRRLILTPLSAFDLLGGISLTYLLMSLISVLLSFAVAGWLGFQTAGSLWLAVLISVLAALAAIAAGLITACFSRTLSRAAVIANFPLLILLFFSGAIFPLPSPVLFTLGERSIRLFDFLPTSHAVTALNQVLNLGVGLEGIAFELAALCLLTGLLLAVAVWLFRSLQMKFP